MRWPLLILGGLLLMRKITPSSLTDYASNVAPGSGRALTVQQCYDLARSVGFPPDTARRMVAIAIRESGLVPTARCKNCIPGVEEDSIGLWQINMMGDLGRRRLALFGLSSPEQLLDPVVNARAAYITWGGSERNLQIAWQIHQDGLFPYRTKYLGFLAGLPALERLELAYNGSSSGVNA